MCQSHLLLPTTLFFMKILTRLLLIFVIYYLYNRFFSSSSIKTMTEKQNTVVIVGGGLAGLTAAVEAHNQGNTKVILIEKEKNIGGNSMKATSGINAIEPLNNDSREAFIEDTLKSGAGICREDLVIKLVDESRSALDWLIKESEFEAGNPTLDLSVVSRCGGHSVGRTHRCPAQNGRPVPVGWKLVDTLKKRFTSYPDVEVITNAQVLNLLTEPNQKNVKSVVGVQILKKDPETEQESKEEIRANAVVLTSGGFAGQTGKYLPNGKHTLLSEFAPQLVNTATTNGPWAAGEGVRLGLAVGAGIRDMDQVQVHPTGFVDPNNPTAPTKFLAPEALRAYGGILLNGNGKRFIDELTLRDRVTAAVYRQTGTNHNHPDSLMSKVLPKDYAAAYMVLTDDAVEGFGKSTLGFYASKGFFTQAEGIENLAKVLDVDVKELEQEFKEYDQHVGSDKPDKTQKTFFPGPISGPTTYWVALTTPVVHYTMGGLNMNTDAAILAEDNVSVIPGLYGAGEVTGGVHGHNRLAGNSLLECVVFGRTAGRNAALYAQQQ
ncbi:FAD binding domain-containing protein [Cokeromyces recurvatus]|uniref:FAD binding domain-containing protein n=1 Tax=Cokeromyces recurvatus TaxID=90255 RepID=UPI0022208010|nr:FAD binding domain-containing protein [Cokeromyces recurvatus]KAI7906134.1 FAD binding domain-containing protein [Cokeromyces recurvatus]